MNDAPEQSASTTRPKMPLAAKLNSDYDTWALAVNMLLEHIERQGRNRFSDKDAEALINIKAWLDQSMGS